MSLRESPGIFLWPWSPGFKSLVERDTSVGLLVSGHPSGVPDEGTPAQALSGSYFKWHFWLFDALQNIVLRAQTVLDDAEQPKPSVWF